MATRGLREKEKKQNELHQQILNQMLNEPENKFCAECGSKGPRWASWNLGVFICIRCSGIHRNLGVHISKVRSVNLDTWRQEWIESMQQFGNKKAAELWEYHLPTDFRRPVNSDQEMETFIRAKYERSRYKRRPEDPPISKSVTDIAGVGAASAVSPTPVQTAEEAQALAEKKKKKKERKEQLQSAEANFANFDADESSSPSSVQPSPSPDLLGGSFPSTPTGTTPSATPAPVAASLTDDFFTQSQQDVQAAKQKSAKDDIMSLFSAAPPAAAAPTPFGMPNAFSQQNFFAPQAAFPVQQQQQQQFGGFPQQQQQQFGGFPQQQQFGYGAPQQQQMNFNPFAQPAAFAPPQQQQQPFGMNQLNQGFGNMGFGAPATGATLNTQLWK